MDYTELEELMRMVAVLGHYFELVTRSLLGECPKRGAAAHKNAQASDLAGAPGEGRVPVWVQACNLSRALHCDQDP
jgi:hypothetical protein